MDGWVNHVSKKWVGGFGTDNHLGTGRPCQMLTNEGGHVLRRQAKLQKAAVCFIRYPRNLQRQIADISDKFCHKLTNPENMFFGLSGGSSLELPTSLIFNGQP